MFPRLDNLRVYVVLSLCCLSSVSPLYCNLDVRIKQSLQNKGFHRNLTYNVAFTYMLLRDEFKIGIPPNGCMLGLEQELPAGLFVNPDELYELRTTQKTNAVAKNMINIEQPAEEASPISVFMMAPVIQFTGRMWIPVHARYHHARPGENFAKNVIEAPKAFLRCPENWLDNCDSVRLSPANFMCNGEAVADCGWKAIPSKMATRKIEWKVPVGNTYHYYFVAVSSLLSLIVGTVIILKYIDKSKVTLKEKTV